MPPAPMPPAPMPPAPMPPAQAKPAKKLLALEPSNALRTAQPQSAASNAQEAEFDKAWRNAKGRKVAIARLRSRSRRRGATPSQQAYTLYLLAWLHHRDGDTSRALTVMTGAAQRAQHGASSESKAWIEQGLLRLFVETGKSDQGLAALTAIYSEQGQAPKAVGQAIELAKLYQNLKRFDDAAQIWRSLQRREPGAACRYQQALIETVAHKNSDEGLAVAIMDLLKRSLRTGPHRNTAHGCSKSAAQQLVTQADRWLKRGKAKPASEATSLRLAAQFYAQTLSHYSDQELAAYGVCQTRLELKRKRAESLWLQGSFDQCAAAYTALLPIEPSHRTNDAAYRAYRCRSSAWQARPQQESGQGRLERMATALEHSRRFKQLLGAQKRYLCTAQTEAQSQRYAKARLARAETFFSGGLLWESAVAFRQTAFDSGHAGSAIQAAKRYGQVMQILAADDVCRIEVAQDLDRLMQRHCNKETQASNCEQLGASAQALRSITGPML